MRDQILWTEKYRPTKIDDCILPDDLKKTFHDFVAKGELPNLLLSGTPGTGKTTVARATCNELDCDNILINASQSGNIDTLRTTIQNFASTVSLKGGRKIVILDEADFLNPNSTQPALRGFMEEFAANCGFIFTCNFKNRIIGAIRDSRLANIEFRFTNKDKPKLAMHFMKRVKYILDAEHVEYSDGVIAEIIKKYFPDYRRVLNELQRYSTSGKIDDGILARVADVKVGDLIKAMKSKDFDKVRKWTVNNLDNDPTRIYRNLYDALYEHLQDNSIPVAILKIADYQYKSAFVADQEINLVACLIEIMVDCDWK